MSINNIDIDNTESKRVPVNKSIWYITHTTNVAKEFEFLITIYGFKLMNCDFSGREFWIRYQKDMIWVNLWGDYGEIPFVEITNKSLPYNDIERIYNFDLVENFNPIAKSIIESWRKRIKPINERFIHNCLKLNNVDFSELDKDYELYGKDEHILYLKECAKTVKENIEKKKGVLQNVNLF